MLRFRLDKIFDSPDKYPPPMIGTIEVHNKRKNAAQAQAPEVEAMAMQEGQTSAPVRGGPQKTPEPEIKAPTFNKSKSAPAPQSAPPMQQVREPQAGAKSKPPIPVGENDADKLLSADDRASFRALDRERERHRLLANAAKQAKKASRVQPMAQQQHDTEAVQQTPQAQASAADTAWPAAQPVAKATADSLRQKLLQPVGGPNRELLQSAPWTIARSAPQDPPDEAASQTLAMPKPVLLEPKLPNLPGGSKKAGLEANVSPVALAFIKWLQHSLVNRTLKYNETGAAVHFVPEGIALVSPLIFKLYAATQVQDSEIEGHAMYVQREVVKAHWHVVGPANVNILRYRVIGRGGTAAGKLAAIVLSEPSRFVQQPLPPANPALAFVNFED
ncbi:MAG: DNA-binding domain-containing protein [Desulfovibrionaceae bacterium]|nr:DNA-binding domain-containing protein [Desulfovibrionaceae bacterium]